MNQTTYSVDFPPYSIPPTSLHYPQTPTLHASALLPHSQQMTPIRTHTRPDTLPNGPPDSDTTQAPLSTKVSDHPSQPHSTEVWRTASRKRTRNLAEHEHPPPQKADYWLGETLTTSNRFSTPMEETTNEAPARHADHKTPHIFISGVANIKPLIEVLNAIQPTNIS